MANGQATWDRCDTCEGTNACVGCDNVTNSGLVVSSCNGVPTCGPCNSGCTAQQPADLCGVCGGSNACLGCDGVPNSGVFYDQCGDCRPGATDLPRCFSCDGTIDYNLSTVKRFDACGICGGDNACVGCDGVAALGAATKKVYDSCGVCGGNNACRCEIGNDVKELDLCGQCIDPANPRFNFCVGCDGVLGSNRRYDPCGVCNGRSLCVSPCDGVAYGQRRDACGICGGDGTQCINAASNVSAPTRIRRSVEEPELTVGEQALIGLAIAVPVTLVIAAIVAAAFFFIKARTNPYWMVPSGMLDSMNTGIADNPLYAGDDKWSTSAIAT